MAAVDVLIRINAGLSDASERRARWDALQPKRWRRHPVTCPVTGELTTNQSGVSHRALDLIDKGLEWERWRERENHAKQTFYADGSWCRQSVLFTFLPKQYQSTEWRNGRHLYTNFDLLDLVAAITNQRLGRKEDYYHQSTDLKRLEENPDKSRWMNSIELTEDQAYEVSRAGAMLEALLRQVEQNALRKGSALLVQMATGDLTIDQVNKLHAARGDDPPPKE